MEQRENNTELGGYFDYTMNRGDWIVQPSMRMQYYSPGQVPPRACIK